MANLTARKVEAVKEQGMYGDGDGLYLRVGPTGSKSWILRTVVFGHRRELGIGGVGLVSLAEARDLARKYRKVAREGGDPDTLRKRESLTFEEAAKRVHAQLLPTWKNKKHSADWISSVEMYAYPVIGKRPISTVGTSDVLKILSPIWTEKNETASRLKQRIAAVFDWAKAGGHYLGENPVSSLKKALPMVKASGNHMEALPWPDLPAFSAELALRDSVSARTLEFIILTASRSGEARGARWSEIDMSAKLWVVPRERMKRNVEHRVPLTDEALSVLTKMRGLDPVLVFPSQQQGAGGEGKEQSNMVFKALYTRMGRSGFTTHGFRSSFRDWCSESAHVEREIAEAALSHSTGNAVERAYARSDLIDRRRKLMDLWGQYVSGRSGTVVQLVRA